MVFAVVALGIGAVIAGLAALVVRRRPYAMTALLTAIATPLLGLVSTIVSLIGAFRALGALPAERKSAYLSQRIAEAMDSTWLGLVIGLPALVVAIAAFIVISREEPSRRTGK
ncbi:MAG: MotA/TolQ/ExbB proton channel family protein [Myxococcaceae bacterium]|nr:MotA/TolQ/ExbB proton channel family protein [Myxococcaceae bacterium]